MTHLRHWIAFIIFITTPCYALSRSEAIDTDVQKLLTAHYQKYKALEYFSGATLSIYTPKAPIRNYYIGTISHEKDSPSITSETLFQIGSITKSFTAALVLQLEKEKLLKLDDTIQNWLPDYSKWSDINIRELLNMTSGLPNYSDSPLWNTLEYNKPDYIWTDAELINFSYPKKDFSPPLKTGYFYSNTAYLLAALIIEKSTHHDFKSELINRIIKPANLTNTYYPIPVFEKDILKRLAHGYNYNQYDNPDLVGKDMGNNNLTWAAAAGGIVSNSEDIIKWVERLFIDQTILDARQQQKLTSLVSLSSGKPINMTTKTDTRGFGLGVAQMYNQDSLPRQAWFYEGETLGFRAFYMYVPCNGIIISSIFNSATNEENDHAKDLMKKTYQLMLDHSPALHCKGSYKNRTFFPALSRY